MRGSREVNRGQLVAPEELARFGKATLIWAVARGQATFRYASLRATRSVHSKNRVRKVKGLAEYALTRLPSSSKGKHLHQARGP